MFDLEYLKQQRMKLEANLGIALRQLEQTRELVAQLRGAIALNEEMQAEAKDGDGQKEDAKDGVQTTEDTES